MKNNVPSSHEASMVRIHDLMTAFEGLTVAGLQFYADRALVLPGTAVVSAGPIDDHLSYLADVGVGAKEVVRLDTSDLVRDLARSPELRERLAPMVAAGARLQFFVSTRHEEALLAAFGLDWPAAYSAPVAVTEESNDKAALRRLGERLGLSGAFPVNRICSPRESTTVYKTVGELMTGNACDFVVIKRPDLASGDGMVKVPRGRGWADAVDPYLRKHAGAAEIIIEAGHEHVPMSIQWEVGDDGPRFACVSAQLLDADFVHLGNVVSSRALPDVTDADERAMRELTEPFARHYWQRGYRGICGFDLMRAERDGRTYLLECNGRVTATTYAVGIGRQVADRLPAWTVLMTNVEPGDGVRGFADVRDRLGRFLFDGMKGALPFNLRCLSLDEPKCAVAVVAADAAEAEAILGEVRSRLA